MDDTNLPLFDVLSRPASDVTSEDMHLLLRTYRDVMYTANKDLIGRCVRSIQKAGFDNEQQKLNLMARFWCHCHRWRQGTHDVAGRLRANNIPDQRRLDEGVTRLDQVLNLPHIFMGGLHPRTLSSPTAIDIFIQALEEVASEKAEANMAAGRTLPIDMRAVDLTVPNELRLFLSYTDGIEDPDFRYEGICEWAFDGIDMEHIDDPVMFREDSLSYFSARSLRFDGLEEEAYEQMLEHIDVLTGFVTGIARRHSHCSFQSYYLFCRERIRGLNWMGVPNLGYAWRIVFKHFPLAINTRNSLLVFEKIADVLSWYVSWVCDEARTLSLVNQVWLWGPDDGDYDESAPQSEDEIEEEERGRVLDGVVGR